MNSNNFNSSKTVLITGASSGIGYELAQIFAINKYNLVLVARNEQKLNEIAHQFQEKFSILTKIIVEDLSLLDVPKKIFQELQQEKITIDILVNNAGFATYGFFWETDLKDELQMMQLNMVALTHLSKLFLKEMVARQQGKILNIASTAAFQPGPLMAVYYATKAYVLSFSEALANELIGTGVTVTALCPGPTESGFQAKANMERSQLVSGKKIMDAKTVAEIGYRGLMNNQTVVIPGLKNQLLALSIRFTPRNLVTKIVRSMQKKV
jgi:uncharacterized protein